MAKIVIALASFIASADDKGGEPRNAMNMISRANAVLGYWLVYFDLFPWRILDAY